MRLFKLRKEVKIQDVEDFLQVSRNTATRKLNQLINEGKIIRKGNGPATKYIVKNE